MNEEIRKIAEVFAFFEKALAIPVTPPKDRLAAEWTFESQIKFYFIGGVARYLTVGGEPPNDIDIYVGSSNVSHGYYSPFLRKIDYILEILKTLGCLTERVGDFDVSSSSSNTNSNRAVQRYIIAINGREIGLDLFFYEYNPETTANFLRIRIKDAGVYSIKSCYGSKLNEALRDARLKMITVNPEIPEDSLTDRIWLWRRVMKYYVNGWTLNVDDEYTMKLVPLWLFEKITLTEKQGDELCSLSQKALKDCGHVIRTPCGHYFDGVEFTYCLAKQRFSRNKVVCPTCQRKIPIVEGRDGDEVSEDEDWY